MLSLACGGLQLLGSQMDLLWIRRPIVASVLAVVLFASAGTAQDGVLGMPMSRGGSGTSWLPDAAPMHAMETALGGWTLMTHGVAFLQYDNQGGTRGRDQ